MVKLNSFCVRVYKENGIIIEQTRPQKLLDALETYRELDKKYFPQETNDYPSFILQAGTGGKCFYTDEWIEEYIRNWKGDVSRMRWFTNLRWHISIALPSGLLTVECLHSSQIN